MLELSTLLRGVAGVIALLYGRKFFWLFVALAGFLAGMTLSRQLMPNADPGVRLVIAIGIGVVGALLARALPGLVVSVVGFMVGCAAFITLLSPLVNLAGPLYWIAVIAAGIVGVILAATAFDLALVVLSSLAGASALATLAAQWISLPEGLVPVVFVALFVFGVLFQLNVVGGSKRR